MTRVGPGSLVQLELEGATVAVVGLGKSGQAAARLCTARGARVIGIDTRSEAELPADVGALGIELRLGPHTDEMFAGAELVVVSPGVPAFPVFAKLEARGVLVIGELELACRYVSAPIIAVGGTNGKSTTTELIGAICRAADPKTFIGGNLGVPASDAVGAELAYCVLEVSSFQLERAPTFHPKVSLLLNITEDHLDRYAGLPEYAAAKGNAFVNQDPGDFAIVPEGDALCIAQAARGRGKLMSFGRGGDYAVTQGSLLERSTAQRLELPALRLHGQHNLDNLSAAVAAARCLGLDWDVIARGIEAFEPLPHRMQLVGRHAGVNYYDDSKATNVGAAVTAISGLAEPRCVLIAGGRDKQGSYAPLVEALERRARAVVVLGEAAQLIASAVGERLPVHHATDMQRAVELAARLAEPGDAVLLSPACSSFDMFTSYADRGRVFAGAVNSLAGARGS